MNREAMLRILNRPREPGAVAMADPPRRATYDLPCHGAEDPRARLWSLLDTWGSMNEDAWPEANVRALYNDILDVFRDHPEAEGWYREWRAKHQEARLC